MSVLNLGDYSFIKDVIQQNAYELGKAYQAAENSLESFPESEILQKLLSAANKNRVKELRQSARIAASLVGFTNVDCPFNRSFVAKRVCASFRSGRAQVAQSNDNG